MASTWNEFHRNPRTSYYLFLRRDYHCSAKQALEKVKQTDAMIVGIQREGLEAPPLLSATSFMNLVGRVRSAMQSLKRFPAHAIHRSGPVSRRLHI